MNERISDGDLDNLEFAWVDLETTGLEADKDVPLELGIIISTTDDKIVAERKWLVWEDEKDFAEGVVRGHKNYFVRAMHQKSDLWRDLNALPRNTRAEVDMQAVEWLIEIGVPPQSLPMAGSSIGSLDRPFALVHFPNLNGFLHYRNVDISSIKEICRRRNPALYENMMRDWKEKQSEPVHRVLEDCYASFDEYQMYLREFLIVE